jgi:hypothetical protein
VKFSLSGSHNTFDATIVWKDGRLSGPDDLVAAVESEARRLEGTPIHAPDADDVVYSTGDHLQNPHAAREIIRRQFDPTSNPKLEILEGTFPPAPRYRTRLSERE